MNVTRLAARLAVATAATVLAGTALSAPGAQAAAKPLGKRSLAQVLAKDTSGFDHNGHDYDILKAAVGAVLKAKPKSAVAVLADGSKPLTAFLPNDRAFQVLVADITKKGLPSERNAFTAVAGLGIDTVESVLLYHVVPGATITARQAVRANGVRLKTAADGATIKVSVKYPGTRRAQVWLTDADTNDISPRVVRFDINKGNRQIAHGINLVLRPVDLP